ncbi:hypothetical protein E2C01_000388 [Portunus trituberculatus]|uniref:Uncharacterized protein n=1 Tax=Portunus trituberculatus TaxID=210409 RepID=A0A5B7CGC2_PORTR|nr:hypothetical protein [Portunus trituberculatus]
MRSKRQEYKLENLWLRFGPLSLREKMAADKAEVVGVGDVWGVGVGVENGAGRLRSLLARIGKGASTALGTEAAAAPGAALLKLRGAQSAYKGNRLAHKHISSPSPPPPSPPGPLRIQVETRQDSQGVPKSPLFSPTTSPLPSFPFPPLSRPSQRMLLSLVVTTRAINIYSHGQTHQVVIYGRKLSLCPSLSPSPFLSLPLFILHWGGTINEAPINPSYLQLRPRDAVLLNPLSSLFLIRSPRRKSRVSPPPCKARSAARFLAQCTKIGK